MFLEWQTAPQTGNWDAFSLSTLSIQALNFESDSSEHRVLDLGLYSPGKSIA